MQIPQNNPWALNGSVCHQCGEPLQVDIKRTKKGNVESVVLFCINEKSGCGYYTTLSLQYITGDGPHGFKPEELQKRREEAAVLREFQSLRESSIRELIALLPDLKDIVSVIKSHEERSQSRGEPAGSISAGNVGNDAGKPPVTDSKNPEATDATS